MSLNDSRQKTKKPEGQPAANLFLLDLAAPLRYLETRGDAEVAPDDDDDSLVDRVGAEYDTDLRSKDRLGQHRVKVTIRPVRVNAIDMRR
jgi:hypothetical protein